MVRSVSSISINLFHNCSNTICTVPLPVHWLCKKRRKRILLEYKKCQESRQKIQKVPIKQQNSSFSINNNYSNNKGWTIWFQRGQSWRKWVWLLNILATLITDGQTQAQLPPCTGLLNRLRWTTLKALFLGTPVWISVHRLLILKNKYGKFQSVFSNHRKIKFTQSN